MSRYADGPDGWIGVDLDRTLAYRKHDGGHSGIGDPVPTMVERVLHWLCLGIKVKIFTARVAGLFEPDARKLYRRGDSAEIQVGLINEWCAMHLGTVLPVTAVKDSYCKEIWDDLAVAVEENTGRQLSPSRTPSPEPRPGSQDTTFEKPGSGHLSQTQVPPGPLTLESSPSTELPGTMTQMELTLWPSSAGVRW